ncbi:MAG TPA: cyclase family protein [Myxococcota bacterium]|nr:cyclase family protein [Myxococcota bacterium]
MSEPVTRAWMDRTFEATRNWGRWGAEDERGALNFITAEKRAAAAALATEGVTVSCARDLPVAPNAENPHPAQHHMLVAGDDSGSLRIPGLGATSDFIGVAFHGMATSHIDALCHVVVGGRIYNGFAASEVKSTGARRDSIMVAADGVVSRGVLLDVPRLRGVRWLEPGERIGPEELEQAEAAEGVRVGAGDVLLVATGRDARRAVQGPWDPTSTGLAGLDARCIPWLHERRIAVLGSDGVSDALPGAGIEGWPIPVHQCCLVGMGVHLLDNLALADLSQACATRGRFEFLFVVAPLRVAGGTGSPVNPIAIF